jgi:hypothetical protein
LWLRVRPTPDNTITSRPLVSSHVDCTQHSRHFCCSGTFPPTHIRIESVGIWILTCLDAQDEQHLYRRSPSKFIYLRVTSRYSQESKDRYDEFLRMIREWRHLKMLKRAGRGHDPGGILATAEGECAVLCPACPQPGKNLPENWQDAPQPLQSALIFVCR